MQWFRIFDSLEEAENRVPLNKTVRITIKDHRICLAHTPEGWFAIQDTCPHLGESLSKGKINYLNEITCPWHSYRYSLSDGEECENRTKIAETYEVENRDGGVFICVARDI